MLSRLNRFHGRNSLHKAYRKGVTIRGTHYSLRYQPNPSISNFRLAVVVSKKVHKSAVVRNRIRRRIFEVVRTEYAHTLQPSDIIITVYDRKLADIPHKELSADLSKSFSKIPQTLPPH